MNWHNVALMWCLLSGWFSFLALSYCVMVQPTKVLIAVGITDGLVCLTLATLLVGGAV